MPRSLLHWQATNRDGHQPCGKVAGRVPPGRSLGFDISARVFRAQVLDDFVPLVLMRAVRSR